MQFYRSLETSEVFIYRHPNTSFGNFVSLYTSSSGVEVVFSLPATHSREHPTRTHLLIAPFFCEVETFSKRGSALEATKNIATQATCYATRVL